MKEHLCLEISILVSHQFIIHKECDLLDREASDYEYFKSQENNFMN